VLAYEVPDRPGHAYENDRRSNSVIRKRLDRVRKQRQRLIVLETIQLVDNEECGRVETRRFVSNVFGR
jgi:hypothetical protein